MDASNLNEILDLPQRPSKPREIGITDVLDKGLGIAAIDDLLDTSADFIDILKLGWGTSVVTLALDKKSVDTGSATYASVWAARSSSYSSPAASSIPTSGG